MKENKNINNRARREYEPVKVKVTKVTPLGILCQSGGGAAVSGSIAEMSRTAGDWIIE